MKTPRHQLVPVLSKLVDDSDEKNLAQEIAAYLLAENRTGELDSLARDLIISRTKSGIVEVTAISAHPLTSTVTADIEQRVRDIYPETKKVIIDQRLDDSLVGGVRLEFPEQQLDLSIRNKLNRFKQLTGAN